MPLIECFICEDIIGGELAESTKGFLRKLEEADMAFIICSRCVESLLVTDLMKGAA